MVKKCPHDENDLLIDIFLQLANEYEKSLTQIKDALLIEENEPIILRFWEILDIRLPFHSFTMMGCCAKCGSFELVCE